MTRESALDPGSTPGTSTTRKGAIMHWMTAQDLQQRAAHEGHDQRTLVRRSILERRSYREESPRPISLPRWRAMVAHLRRIMKERGMDA